MKKIFYLTFIFFVFFLTSCKEETKTYTITYLDINNEIIEEFTVLDGDAIPNLSAPIIEGKEFISWETNKNSTINNIIYYPIYIDIEKKEEKDIIYQVVFDSNGASLLSGKEIQYVIDKKDIIYPIYEYYLKEFDGFLEEIDEENHIINFKAKWKDLDILDLNANEWLNNINFGWNYVNISQEVDNDHGKIFDLLIDSGINAITLPFNISFIINDDYSEVILENLNSLKEIVDEAIEREMYVIIAPYDSYTKRWSSLNYENKNNLLKIINTSYKDFVTFFKDYDEHLAISFLAEPRDYDDNSLDKEAYWVLNEANKEFVQMVRNTGGNNLYRNLIITTGWSKTTSQYFEMVDDSHVIVRLHTYIPFEFVHDDDYIHAKWVDKEKEYKTELLEVFQNIKTNFTDKNIPVYIGEFGSRDKGFDNERKLWIEYIVSLAKSQNIKMFTWEAARVHKDKEFTFSLIDRDNYTWLFPEMTDRLVEMLTNDTYIPFFEELKNKNHFLDEEIIIPEYFTDPKTNERFTINVIYDEKDIVKIDNKLYPANIGEIYFKVTINDYDYYYKYNVLPPWDKYETSFTMYIKNNDQGITQCYIDDYYITRGISQMRVDYDWYSTDTSILTINKYSSIEIVNDGTCAIVAINKETQEYGVIEVTIKNKKIVSFSSTITK